MVFGGLVWAEAPGLPSVLTDSSLALDSVARRFDSERETCIARAEKGTDSMVGTDCTKLPAFGCAEKRKPLFRDACRVQK